jgi:hypothetical protein
LLLLLSARAEGDIGIAMLDDDDENLERPGGYESRASSLLIRVENSMAV